MEGKNHTTETRMKMSVSHLAISEIMSKNGLKGALIRWAGHTYTKKIKPAFICKTKEELLERKRFRNQRYKAVKRNAKGSHTIEQWLLLKAFYNYMCLCCKKQEPEIKLSEDHIMPLSKGGSDYIDNIQPLCVSCNTRKHTRVVNYIYDRKGVTT